MAALRVLPLEEMKIDEALFLVGVNDLLYRLARGDEYDPGFLGRPWADDVLAAETFLGSMHLPTRGPLFRRTLTWQLFRKARLFFALSKHQDESGQVYEIWRRKRAEAKRFILDLPDLESALGEYEANLNTMVDLCQERRIRPILVTHPALWRENLPA